MPPFSIPGLVEQIEQIAACAMALKEEDDSKRALSNTMASALEKARIRRQQETEELYIKCISEIGPASVRRIADYLGLTTSTVKNRMVRLRKKNLVRDVGTFQRRIYVVSYSLDGM